MPMKTSQGEMNGPRSSAPGVSAISRNDVEMRRVRILLAILVLLEAVALLAPRFFHSWPAETYYLPLALIGFVVLVSIFAMHLASQRKVLNEICTALNATTAYAEKMEKYSVIDPSTQLFNRRYLDHLFRQHLKWLHRGGKSATLLLFEMLPDGENALPEEAIVEAAFIFRSNFRGSDYVVRYSPSQFLVVLPDTVEQQAQIALSRLIDRIDDWNRSNEKRQMALRLQVSTCPPGGNLWQNLGEMESRLRDKSDEGVRTHVSKEIAAPQQDDLSSQEHPVS